MIWLFFTLSSNSPSTKCGCPVLNSHPAGCHLGPSSSGCPEWRHTGLQGVWEMFQWFIWRTNLFLEIISPSNIKPLNFDILFIDLFLGVSAPERNGAPAYSVPARARSEVKKPDRLHHLHGQCGGLQRCGGWTPLPAHQRAHSASRWFMLIPCCG